MLMRMIQLYIQCSDAALFYNIGTVLVNFTNDEENAKKYFSTDIVREIVQKFISISAEDVESLEVNIFLFSNSFANILTLVGWCEWRVCLSTTRNMKRLLFQCDFE